jgi:hypothetical protein
MVDEIHRARKACHQVLGLLPPRREDCIASRNTIRHFKQILRFCVALSILSARKLSRNQLKFGCDMLQSLCTTYVDMNIHLSPNWHYAMHIESDIEKFGSIHNTWTYATERGNGILSRVNNNRRGAGELSGTLMRGWHRFNDLIDLVRLKTFP